MREKVKEAKAKAKANADNIGVENFEGFDEGFGDMR